MNTNTLPDAATPRTRRKRSRPPLTAGFVNRSYAAAYLGISESYLRLLESQGKGPRGHRIHGSRITLYSIDALKQWAESF